MKMIVSFRIESNTSGGHFMYVTYVTNQANAHVVIAAHPKIAPLLARLNACVAQENQCLKLSQKSFLSDDLKTMDDRRDKVFLGYKYSVEAFMELPVADMAATAKVLNQHIKDYGIDVRMQRDRESGLLLNFIDDLQTKYPAEVAKLNLTPFVEQMKLANDAYIELSSQRTEERTKQTTGALANARKQTDAAYREFIQMVNAVALVEGDAAYADFIDYTNELIRHYKQEVLNQPVSSQQGSGSTPSGGEQGGTTTPDNGDTPEQPGTGTEPTPGDDNQPDTGGGGSTGGDDDDDEGGLEG